MDTTVSPPLRLFVDFDGTITERDVGDGIFTRFMRRDVPPEDRHDALIAAWKAGYLSSEECLSRECANVVATEMELCAELDTYELTAGFAETAAFCDENGIPLAILSDGMDYYISHVLDRHGLGGLPYYANHMRFENGGLVCEFPHMAHGCGRCGNCKRSHMKRLTQAGDHVIYVGDGYSDRFAIKSADTVFARRDLAEYCEQTGHPYHPFDDFGPILSYLEQMYVDV